MLIIIESINVFFMHNLRLQNLKYKYLIDDMTIDSLFFLKFCKGKEY